MTGYVRKDTTNNIADGNVINAADLDAEFDGVQDAFNASTGHKHDGTAGEGATINALGPTQDVTISATLVAPKTTNTVDIGSSALKFKDLFLAGNGSIGGTLAVTGVATFTAQPILSSLTASRAVFSDGSKGLVSNAITGTGNVVMSASPTLTGTIDAAALTASGNLTLSAGTANGVAYLNGSKVVTSGSALTFDGTTLALGLNGSFRSDFSGNGLIVSKHNVGPVNAIRSVSNTSDVLLINDSASGFANTAFYSSGSEAMRLTSTGLGIGTSTVGARLTTQASANSYVAGALQINSLSGTYKSYITNVGGLLLFSNSSTVDQLILDSSGNVGIGTSTPTTKLDVIGGVRVGGMSGATGNKLYFDTTGGAGANNIGTANDYNLRIECGRGASSAFTAATNSLQFEIGASEVGRFTSTGLGIGTSSPSTKLDVYDASSPRVAVSGPSTATGYLIFRETTSGVNRGYVGYEFANDAIPFATAGSERMRLDSSGNLGVGTASPSRFIDFEKNQNAGTLARIGNTTSGTGAYSALQLSSSGTTYLYNFSAGYTTSGIFAANTSLIDSGANSLNFNSAGNAWYLGGSEQMRLTSTGLGIGTSSPNVKLDVVGTVRSSLQFDNGGQQGSTTGLVLGGVGSYYGRVIESSNNVWALGYSSTRTGAVTNAVVWDSSGNLGLGVTPSAWGGYKALQIGAGSSLAGWASDAGTDLSSNAYYGSGAWRYIASAIATRYQITATGENRWYTAASGTAGNAITFTQAMTLDASGNLLVGTTSALLGVGSTHELSLNGLNGSTVSFGYNGTLGTYLFQNGSNFQAINYLNGYMSFGTNATERARIDSSGNLLVGTTGQTLGTARLCVSSSGLTTVSTTSTSTESPYASFNTATSGNNQFMWFYTGDSGQTFRGSIEYNRGGGVVAYNTTSDYRLKENIVDLPNALATVAQLKPRQFDWKETGNTTTGFIAHELAEVCPHAVTGEKDAVDEEGNPKYQGIDTSFLVATLTAAIQEQQAIINSLKARLDAANL